MIAVSSCLVGNNTKYDGGNNKNEYVLKYLKDKDYILICPEVLGGLSTPRDPSEQLNDKVISNKGKDVTKEFNLGAKLAIDFIIKNNVNELILKQRSPSCGKGRIYDGTFSKKLIDGDGVLVKLLKENNINLIIYNELEIENIIKEKEID